MSRVEIWYFKLSFFNLKVIFWIVKGLRHWVTNIIYSKSEIVAKTLSLLEIEKRRYLAHCYSDKGFKSHMNLSLELLKTLLSFV